MKQTDYARRIKHAERLAAEIITVIVAGLLVGYLTGGLGWW